MAYRRSFKRKRPFSGRRMIRRTRFRKRTGGRKFSTFTAHKGPFSGTNFRSRKLRPHAWRRSLFTSTRHDNHWRSNSATSSVIATATTLGQGTVTTLAPFIPGGSAPFWTVAGGAVPTDTGVAVPLFNGDIVIRGGKIGLSLVKDVASVDVVQVQVWVVRVVPNPELGLIPATAPLGWDPSITADIARSFGRIVAYRTVNLVTTGEDFNMEFRLGPQKCDQHVTLNDVGSQPVFMIKAANLTSNTPVNISAVMYHNMSFTGDAIGTT